MARPTIKIVVVVTSLEEDLYRGSAFELCECTAKTSAVQYGSASYNVRHWDPFEDTEFGQLRSSEPPQVARAAALAVVEVGVIGVPNAEGEGAVGKLPPWVTAGAHVIVVASLRSPERGPATESCSGAVYHIPCVVDRSSAAIAGDICAAVADLIIWPSADA